MIVAVNAIRGCSVKPNTVIQPPTRMNNAGTKGHAKLTAGNFCQPGRFRKMKSDATVAVAKKFSRNPTKRMRSGKGVRVIIIATAPCKRIAATGVRHLGCTLPAIARNAPC